MERIQKILSQRGVASRRQAEQMILAGRVTCNGQLCSLGQTADPDVDEIMVDGKPLPSAGSSVYIMLNKPKGYVTTLSDEKGRKTVADLVSDAGLRVYPVGRLDIDSDGLLIMTNDGELTYALTHPSHEVEKTYIAEVKGNISGNIDRLGKPMLIDGYRIKPARVKVLEEHNNGGKIEVVIHEGRNRQVRKMCALCGLTVKRLHRIAMGSLNIGNLPYGKWRYLSENEVAYLKKISEKKDEDENIVRMNDNE